MEVTARMVRLLQVRGKAVYMVAALEDTGTHLMEHGRKAGRAP
jgi:hypothetical protein